MTETKMKPFVQILAVVSLVLLPVLNAAEPREADIAINQVGYRIKDENDFRLARSVGGFQIPDGKNAVVFDGKMTGPVSDQYAGCDVWKGVFTELKKPGTYVIRLSDGMCSWPFQIGDDVYSPLLQTALRGLYMRDSIHKGRTPPPPEKAYIDVVTAHWCNETDIEVQGHLIGLSAYFHSTAGTSR